MGEFSLSHILLFSLVLLIFFGPSRLPALGQSIGKAIKGFKQGLNEIDTEAKDVSPNQQIQQPDQKTFHAQQQNTNQTNSTTNHSS